MYPSLEENKTIGTYSNFDTSDNIQGIDSLYVPDDDTREDIMEALFEHLKKKWLKI